MLCYGLVLFLLWRLHDTPPVNEVREIPYPRLRFIPILLLSSYLPMLCFSCERKERCHFRLRALLML